MFRVIVLSITQLLQSFSWWTATLTLSSHKNFLVQIRLEPLKPQQVTLDSTVSFVASTLVYILREKPQTQGSAAPGELKAEEDEELKGLLRLPEEETELNNLTEINTAHNKSISTLAVEEDDLDIHGPKRKGRSFGLSFNAEEEIISVEDVDASVGHFRNMNQTAVVGFYPICVRRCLDKSHTEARVK
ncbi:nuclear inhibitor of protein phosphatase 1-like [Xiphias gladius]|uniref:nuclear inhibitor of protein phosphatase 1-like n=1 Tax=Xiphias gladius TaxID=8245 RepID=UPI001A98B766|nr:nuclear inhibitor of protein phosphatase 1-like [Xiphias gladius]